MSDMETNPKQQTRMEKEKISQKGILTQDSCKMGQVDSLCGN